MKLKKEKIKNETNVEILAASGSVIGSGFKLAVMAVYAPKEGEGPAALEEVIAAARELQDRGHPVTIIEGRERIGGRVWTSKAWKDTPMDLGASWIHGTARNPLTKLAKSAGAKTVATDSDEWPVHGTDGKLLEFGAFEAKATRDVNRVLMVAMNDRLDQSVLAAIEARTPLAKMAKTDREKFRFLRGEATCDLRTASRNFFLDDRCGINMVIEDDRHPLLQVFLR